MCDARQPLSKGLTIFTFYVVVISPNLLKVSFKLIHSVCRAETIQCCPYITIFVSLTCSIVGLFCKSMSKHCKIPIRERVCVWCEYFASFHFQFFTKIIFTSDAELQLPESCVQIDEKNLSISVESLETVYNTCDDLTLKAHGIRLNPTVHQSNVIKSEDLLCLLDPIDDVADK